MLGAAPWALDPFPPTCRDPGSSSGRGTHRGGARGAILQRLTHSPPIGCRQGRGVLVPVLSLMTPIPVWRASSPWVALSPRDTAVGATAWGHPGCPQQGLAWP